MKTLTSEWFNVETPELEITRFKAKIRRARESGDIVEGEEVSATCERDGDLGRFKIWNK